MNVTSGIVLKNRERLGFCFFLLSLFFLLPSIYTNSFGQTLTGSISPSAITVTQGDPSPVITFTGENGTTPYTFTYSIDHGSSESISTPIYASGNKKLVFVHHSTGGALLADVDSWQANSGGLGSALMDAGYFVSDICYGWDAPYNAGIGSFTDIGHWYRWFADYTIQANGQSRNDNIVNAVYTEYDMDSYNTANYGPYTRGTDPDPGGENEIIMIKSCYPNSNILADDGSTVSSIFFQDAYSGTYTESNVRALYNLLLDYMKDHPDKMFVVVTAPSLYTYSDIDNAARARSFNNWLVTEWLQSPENDWENKNVFVYDYFNIMTDLDNHHQVEGGVVVHHTEDDSGNSTLLEYVSTIDYSHPNSVAARKFSTEFVPCLDIWYDTWLSWRYPSGSSLNTATVSAPTSIVGQTIYYLENVEDANSQSQSLNDSTVVTIVADTDPSATIVCSATDVCVGDDSPVITFTGTNGTAPYTFRYRLEGGTTGDQSITSTGDIATIQIPTTNARTYAYTLLGAIDADNVTISATGSASVTIHEIPSATVARDTSICYGGNANLILNFTSGEPKYTYRLTGDETDRELIWGDQTSLMVSPASTSVYQITALHDSYCTASPADLTTSATVTVNPLPTATISGDAAVCQNSSPLPQVTFTGDDISYPYTFTYSIDGGGEQTISSSSYLGSVNAPTTTSGTFTYSLLRVSNNVTTCSQNITSDNSVDVIVRQLPTATISEGASVCQYGESPEVIFAGSNGTAPYTFTYSINGVMQTPVTTSGEDTAVHVSVGTTIAGNFTYTLVSVADSYACPNSVGASAGFTVYSSPTASVSGSTSICDGGDALVNINFTGIAPFIYRITGDTEDRILESGTQATVAVSPNMTTTYRVEQLSDFNNCEAIADNLTGSAVITVNPRPTAEVLESSITENLAYCSETLTEYIGDPAETSTFYGWEAGNVSVTTDQAYDLDGNMTLDEVNCLEQGFNKWMVQYNHEAQPNTTYYLSFDAQLVSGTNATCYVTNVAPASEGGAVTLLTHYDYINDINTEIPTRIQISFTTESSIDELRLIILGRNSGLGCLSDAIVLLGRVQLATTSSATYVTTNLEPAPSSDANSVCYGGSTVFQVHFTGTPPFRYRVTGDATDRIAYGDEANVAVSPSTSTIYHVTQLSDAYCTAAAGDISGSTLITVHPLPTATISSGSDVCLNSDEPQITFGGINGTFPYSFVYNVNGSSQDTVKTTAEDISVSVDVPTGTAGDYIYNLISVSDSYSCANIINSSSTVIVAPYNTITHESYLGATTQTVCIDNPITEIVFRTTGSTGAVFDGLPDGVSGSWLDNIITIEGTPTISGTFGYIVTMTGGCTGGTNTASGTITVNPNNTITLTSDEATANQSVCVNSPIESISYSTTGASGATVAGLPSGVTGSWSDNIFLISGTPTVSGTFYYTVTMTGGCSGGINSIDGSITVNPLPTASISGVTSVCDGSSAALFATGGTAYAWYAGELATGDVLSTTSDFTALNITSDTSFTVLVMDDNGCSVTATSEITVLSRPAAEITGDATICNGGSTALTINFSGTPPFIYRITGDSEDRTLSSGTTAMITVLPSNSGTTPISVDYGVTQLSDRNCVAWESDLSGNALVTVNPRPTAVIAGSTSICNGESAVLNIDFTGTAPFIYRITGDTEDRTLNSGNTANISVTPTVTGTAPQVFNYSVTQLVDNNCAALDSDYSGTVSVTVYPLPDATISGTAAVCEGSSSPVVTFTGSNGLAPYTFVYTVNGEERTVTSAGASSSVQVSVPTDLADTYTYALVSVTDGRAESCSNAASGEAVITVNPLPSATIAGDAEVCAGSASPVVTFTGSNGTSPYIFTYSINGGSLQTVSSAPAESVATVAVPTTVPGEFVYTLTGVVDGGTTSCSVSLTESVTVVVDPLPSATISGTTAVCVGSSHPEITFTGSNGTSPYTFTYTVNGGVPATISTVSGDAVTLDVPTDVSGTYVYALAGVSDASCSNAAVGEATVTVNPLPAAVMGIEGSTDLVVEVCLNEISPVVEFTGSNGTSPYTFTYTVNGITKTLTSTDDVATVSVPTTAPGTFEYSLVSVRDASTTRCDNPVSGVVTVTVNPLPMATIGGSSGVCLNGASPDITFTGSNGTSPYTFGYTVNNGAVEYVTTVSGSSVSVPVSTGTVGSYTYTLVSVGDASTTHCSRTVSGFATVTVYSLPDATISGTAAVCEGSSSPVVTFTGSNGLAPYTFVYTVNGEERTVTSAGASSSVQVSVPTDLADTYTYALVSVTDGRAESCSNAASGEAVITVNPRPAAAISGDAVICDGESTMLHINFTGTAPFVYRITGDVSDRLLESGNTATIIVSPANSTSTQLTVNYEITQLSDQYCTAMAPDITGSAEITVNPLPIASISGNTSVCVGSEQPAVIFTGSNGSGDYTFTYSINGGAIQTVSTDPEDNSVPVYVPTTTVGSYEYTLSGVSSSGSGCDNTASGSVTVTVLPLPDATITGTGSVCQDATSPYVFFSGSSAIAPYTFTYTINGIEQDPVATTVYDNYVRIPVPTDVPGEYEYEITGVSSNNGVTCTKTITGQTTTVTVNPKPTATISSSVLGACVNTSVRPVITFTGQDGTAPYTFTYSINGVLQDPKVTTSGNSSVNFEVPVNIEGNYTYELIGVNDALCSGIVEDQSVTVSIATQPIADPGNGGDECDLDFVFNAPDPIGIGYWAIVSGPGTADFTPDVYDNDCTVTVSEYGTYIFMWTEEYNDGCSNSNTITVNFYQMPPAISGEGGTECDLDFDLNATLTVGHGLWSKGSGPGTVTFSNSTAPTGTVTVSTYGSYIFTWIETNGSCVNTSAIVVDFNEVPELITDAAGEDHVVCGLETSLSAVAHEYLPAPDDHSGSLRTWSLVSGPGLAVFTDAGNPESNVSVTRYGNYTFRWSETNGDCSEYDEVSVDFNEEPVLTGDAAGADLNVCGLSTEMSATPYSYLDSPNDHSGSTRGWIQVDGPGTAVFTDINSPTSSVSVDIYGVYTFSWSETNGPCSYYDEVSVDFNESPENISAGNDKSVCGLTAIMDGSSFTYSGSPNNHEGSSRSWSVISGPGNVGFGDVADPLSSVVVDAYGVYYFRFAETNGSCTVADEVIIDFNEDPVNVFAGVDFSSCGLNALMNASTHDYLSEPNDHTGSLNSWSFVSGPGTTMFSDPTSASSSVSVDEYGDYVFRWTEINGPCERFSEVTVSFINAPVADAGDGGDTCGLSFDLNASLISGSGLWGSSGPGDAVFVPDANVPDATVYVDNPGNYIFTWTVNNGACTSSNQVDVTFHEPPGLEVSDDMVICEGSSVTLDATGNGTFSWSPAEYLSNSSSGSTVATPDMSMDFVVVLTDQWGCENSETVRVDVQEKPVVYAGSDQELEYILETNLEASLGVGEIGYWTVAEGDAVVVDTSDPYTSVSGMSLHENIFVWSISDDVCGVVSDSMTVYVNDLVIPTLITPNYDGKNDYFVLRGIETLGGVELIVLDRRGREIFKTSDYANDWDGIDYNGDPLPEDTYFLIIKSESGLSVSSYIVIRR